MTPGHEREAVRDHAAVHRYARPADEGPLGRLLDLVMQRLALARDVAAAKYASGRPIDDRVREREILQAVASALEASGARQQAGMRFFRDQIEASKVIQRGLHHRWYAHPEEVPFARCGLDAEVRAKISRINTQIVQQFESAAELPRMSQEDVAGLLGKRLATEVSARQLPRLHRAAALFAMRSLCTR
jgi:chorismate mutase